MRTLEEIENRMIDKIKATPELAEKLTSNNKSSLWRLWVYIMAFAQWSHEQIVARHARNSRPHTLRWYRDQALKYIEGLPLIWKDGQFSFNTQGLSRREMERRSIIKRCAALEGAASLLIIKVAAQGDDGKLKPLEEEAKNRFIAYMNQIKDAGNKIEVISNPPDRLKIELEIYYDPLTLDASGVYFSEAKKSKPAEKALYDYLSALEFNGAIVKTFLTDALQKAQGVELPIIKSIEWRYGQFPWKKIEEWQIPSAGYFEVQELTINYKPYDLAEHNIQ